MKIADRYEPTGAAHWGGMSEVHECTDVHLSRQVMLKRVKSAADFSRLLDEKKALMLLRSKHVIELLDVVQYNYNGTSENGLILEKIVGNDLKENSFDPDASYKRCVYQVTAGLSDIHDAQVIHRDIKPENIHVDAVGVIKILDFGLAREQGKDNKTKSIAGTKGFMAPELFGSSTITFTQAVDVFAFGVTAASLLKHAVGKSLVPKDAKASALQGLYPGLDGTTADLISACLQSVPSKRPKMREARDVLARGLLYNKHRARIFLNKEYELNEKFTSIKIGTAPPSLEISYNGYEFYIKSCEGPVFVNNQPVKVGDKMLDACVITLGANTGAPRAFLTFDVSNPEV